METGLLLSLGSAPLLRDPEKEISKMTFCIRPGAPGLLRNPFVQALIAKYLFSTPSNDALDTYFYLKSLSLPKLLRDVSSHSRRKRRRAITVPIVEQPSLQPYLHILLPFVSAVFKRPALATSLAGSYSDLQLSKLLQHLDGAPLLATIISRVKSG